jgi:hypothetical protein
LGLGEAFAAGDGEADAPFRADLRASTRARRRVFFAGDADGDAVSVTAAFPGLGDGDGSAANTLDSAISPMAADKTKTCLIIYNIWFLVRVGGLLPLKSGQRDLLRPNRPTTARCRQSSETFSRFSINRKRRLLVILLLRSPQSDRTLRNKTSFGKNS